LDLRFGLAMLIALCLTLAAASGLAAHAWLPAGIGLFVVGWVLQFIGHYFEGRKPAFVDDLIGLLVGPLFIAAETAFMLGLRHGPAFVRGLRRGMRPDAESKAGPPRFRPLTAPAP